jgi:diaminopimelate epimerase
VSELAFYKMTGSGNDFVVLDGRASVAAQWMAPQIKALCDRRNGVGADGLVILTPLAPEAVRMQYWNSDGSVGAMCGNAALCSARLARVLDMVAAPEFCLLTDSGSVRVRTEEGREPEINLPDVELDPEPLAGIDLGPGERWMRFVRVGVPHLVVRVDDVSAIDLPTRGRSLRWHPALGPEGANANFISHQVGGDASWLIRTYERGVEGETLACGSGTVAATLALASAGEAKPPLELRSRGGLPLEVRATVEGNRVRNIWLRGQGRLVYRGYVGSAQVSIPSKPITNSNLAS